MRMWMVAAMVAVLVVTGCASDDDDAGSDGATAAPTSESTTEASEGSPETTAPAATPTSSTGGTYVVQEAGAATLAEADDGTATLTLTDARPDSITFTDADAPRAASAPNQDVLDVLFAGDDEHDAALTFDAPTGAGTIVVTVLSGTWDPDTATLTYQVRPIEVDDVGSDAVAARAGSSPPTELPDGVTSSSFFIDPIQSDRLIAECNLTVVNDTAWTGTVGSIDRSDSGGMVDWDTPFTDGQEIPSGQQITAESGAYAWGCGATVSIDFDPLDDYTVTIKMDDPVFAKSTWSCATPSEIGCTIDANTGGQPLNMTVTLRT